MSRRAVSLASVLVVMLVSLAAAPAGADDADVPVLQQRVMNIAHAGGENEAPGDTIYALRRAVALGADMIDIDIQSTRDDQLVAMHDATVDRTTDGSGRIADLTLDEVRELDAAYNFVPGEGPQPGRPDGDYPFRGVRTGDRKPPAGYKRQDFRVPTLRDVLRTFPDTPINIEFKGGDGGDESAIDQARLLAAELRRSGRVDDVMVTSFNDRALAVFHELMPEIGLSPGETETIEYVLLGERPIDGTVAIQVPPTYAGFPVVTRELVERAHADGYAVQVYFSGSPETEETYSDLLDLCVDGLMSSRPGLLEQVLDERGIVRPDQPGVDPCA